MVGLIALFIGGGFLAVVGNAYSLSDCQYGVYIHSRLMEAAVTMTSEFTMVRARLGSDAYLVEGLQCLEGLSKGHAPGIKWAVIEGGCRNGHVFDPWRIANTSTVYDCSPATYLVNPWGCSPGDLTGKFGPLDLGLGDILVQLRRSRFLLSDVGGQIPREDVRVFHDPLPIPPCTLTGKSLALFCADGRIAACGDFQSMDHYQAGNYTSPIEKGLRFLITASPDCQTSHTPDPRNPQSNPPPNNNKDSKWGAVGKVPDYVSNWWDEVKRKGREAWNYQ